MGLLIYGGATPAAAMPLTDPQRAELQRIATSPSLPHRKVVQARALLWAADSPMRRSPAVPASTRMPSAVGVDASPRTALRGLARSPRVAGASRGCRRPCPEVLRITQGPDHPNVARDAASLAVVLRELGDLAGARRGFERALAIDEAAFDPNHPNVARDVHNLAGVLKELGDLTGAWHGFERALAIDESALGPDHPRAVVVAQNLRSLYLTARAVDLAPALLSILGSPDLEAFRCGTTPSKQA
jgi:tetratricopeptide (TPR) repeat protein